MLLPIIEFAHNARPHRSTHKSPFEVWYGFQPTFKPPLQLQTRIQSVDERIQYLEQIHKEVTATLLLAAKEMQKGGPPALSHAFHKDNLVLLEATNLQTTHPKAKLAPRRYGPFKVIWASPTNCKLELPPSMKVHPVFHNSLLKPYIETPQHGPNFARPPPDIVAGEEGHYEIEKILVSRPTRNHKSTQYLVKWKGYPDSENSWLPAKELTHAKELLAQFQKKSSPIQAVTKSEEERLFQYIHEQLGPLANPATVCRWFEEFKPRPKTQTYSKSRIEVLQAQQRPKEGILSQAKLVTAQTQTQPHSKPPSPQDPALKPTYSQALKAPTQPCDPGKPSRNPLPPSGTCDQAHDQTPNLPHDVSHVVSNTTRSPDLRVTRARTYRATRPLPHVWKTVGVKSREGIPQGIPHSLPKTNPIGCY